MIVAGENEPQHTELLRSADEGGCELDALANDDFHHAAMVRLTGRREAYYSDYEGSAEEFIACAKWGYLFQGQRYALAKESARNACARYQGRAIHQFLAESRSIGQFADRLARCMS